VRRRRLRRTDDGTAIVEFVWLAVLLLMPLLYLMLAAFDTQRAAYAASAAARSATRAFVAAPDQATGYRQAQVAADLAFADQGLAGDGFRLTITCAPDPAACLVPGSVVIAQIRTGARLPLLPSAFGGSAPTITISAEHRSPYGTFREARE
jgi:Flp pilus assembly protein TadG